MDSNSTNDARPNIATRQVKHSHSSPDGSIIARPRKRVATACSVCRARKTKCDGRQPRCSYCLSVGAACDSAEADLILSSDTQTILDRIDRLEKALKGRSADTGSPFTVSTTPLPMYALLPGAGYQSSTKNVSFFNVESVLCWPIFEGEYRSYPSLSQLMKGETMGSCFSLPVSRVQVQIDFENESVSTYLDNFFNRIHIKNPILNESEVRRWAKDIALNGIGWDARSCLVLLVYALGAVSVAFISNPTDLTPRSPSSEERNLAETCYIASQKRIGMLLSEGGGTLEAQCFFFSGVYLMHTFRPFAGWSLFLQAIACCQTFQCFSNNNREQAQLSNVEMVATEWSSEESIYWTCFKTELETRCQLSLPSFAVSDLSYPDFLPSPPPESIEKEDQAWFFYLAEIALRQLANQILTLILPYSDGLQVYNLSKVATWMPEFENQAEKWSQILPPKVDIQAQTDDEDVLRFILKGHLRNCYESMYWPFVSTAINFPAQRDASFDCFVRKGLLNCVDRIWINESGFYHRHHGTWSMMRSCTTSALVLIAAERSHKLEDLLPEAWELPVTRVIDLLDFWSGDCGDAGSRRDILKGALHRATEYFMARQSEPRSVGS